MGLIRRHCELTAQVLEGYIAARDLESLKTALSTWQALECPECKEKANALAPLFERLLTSEAALAMALPTGEFYKTARTLMSGPERESCAQKIWAYWIAELDRALTSGRKEELGGKIHILDDDISPFLMPISETCAMKVLTFIDRRLSELCMHPDGWLIFDMIFNYCDTWPVSPTVVDAYIEILSAIGRIYPKCQNMKLIYSAVEAAYAFMGIAAVHNKILRLRDDLLQYPEVPRTVDELLECWRTG